MTKKDKTNKPGTDFEKAVAAMQAMMGPNAIVTHDEKIRDRLGRLRQFDVVIRGKIAGHAILGVIECKDLKKPVGSPQVEAFVTKSRDVNANLKLLASKKGFYKPALEKAKDYGIGTISLLPDDTNDCGLYIGVDWYAEIYSWSKVKITLQYLSQKSPVEKFHPNEIMRGGCKVIEWFQKQLVTNYLKEEQEGWYRLELTFDKPRKFQVSSKKCFIKSITFHALRKYEKKKKMVRLGGDGFVEWNKGQLTIPPEGKVVTNAFRTDFTNWETYDGEIPPSSGFFEWRLKCYLYHFDPKKEVIDLMNL